MIVSEIIVIWENVRKEVVRIIGYCHWPSSKVIRDNLKKQHKPYCVKFGPLHTPLSQLTVPMSGAILARQEKTEKNKNRIHRALWSMIMSLDLGFMLCAVSYGRVLSRRSYKQIYILRLNLFLCGAELLKKETKTEMEPCDRLFQSSQRQLDPEVNWNMSWEKIEKCKLCS